MKEFPLVSIIIPCYNDPKFIEEAIDSALEQTYRNKELIVIDDGSNFETKMLLKTLSSKINILIHQRNKGVSAARNKGISMAQGEFLVMLDSDDFFEPAFCEKAVLAFQSRMGIKMVTSFGKIFGNVKEPFVYKPQGGALASYLKENSSLAVCFRKEDCLKAGGYDEAMTKGFEDWEFYIRLLKEGGETFVIPEVLFNYRRKTKSRSTVANQCKYEILKSIYLKHQDLYKKHFELFVASVLDRAKREEQEKIKASASLEQKVGEKLISSFYKVKSLLRNWISG